MNKPQERKLPQQVSVAEAPVSDKRFTPVYFRSIELVESCGHKQDAFDIEHDAWIVSMTTRPCPKDRPFGEHFLALVRDQIKVFRDEQRTLQRRGHRTEELEGHAETCIVPFVGSTASPEDLMIAHEEAQEREEKLGVMRARIRMLQQAVAHNPVAVKVLEFFAEYGGKKPLTELARRLQLPADDVYDAKQLIEKHARHIFASTQGEDQ